MCNRGELLRRGDSNVGRLCRRKKYVSKLMIRAWPLCLEEFDLLNGFFFKTKNTVSSNSRYLVR